MMMKHAFSIVLLGLGTAVLGGCPIYSGDSSDEPCASGRCSNGSITPPVQVCARPADCASGSNCGADHKCHTENCATTGCPTNYVCKLESGVPVCAPPSPVGVASTCSNDQGCATPGAKCLSGACVNPADQCVDGTQCAEGSQCVAGECTPSCSATKPCPSGYSCDSARGVCSGNPAAPCTSSSQCTGGAVCAQEHCVAPCGDGASCSAGLTCVDGGCVTNEKPVFACDENQKCHDDTSVCIRHTCYIACDTAVTDSCKNADKFNVCKTVTADSKTHSVCSSETNLGTECDTTKEKNCGATQVCIDGFCR